MGSKTKSILMILWRIFALGSLAWLIHLIFGIYVGAGILVFLVFHEAGHAFAMKALGIKIKNFGAIPFLGAYVMPEGGANWAGSYRNECIVAIAGVVSGMMTYILAKVLFYTTFQVEFLRIMKVIALISLFNLLPISFLDGGRIVKCLVLSVNNDKVRSALSFGIPFVVYIAAIVRFEIFIAFLAFLGRQHYRSLYKDSKDLKYYLKRHSECVDEGLDELAVDYRRRADELMAETGLFEPMSNSARVLYALIYGVVFVACAFIAYGPEGI